MTPLQKIIIWYNSILVPKRRHPVLEIWNFWALQVDNISQFRKISDFFGLNILKIFGNQISPVHCFF